MFEHVGPNRGVSPTLLGHHTCAKNITRSKLLISKYKENISKRTSRKYALLYTKIDIEIL